MCDRYLDRTCAALADPTRRAILARLRRREARVTDLARPFDMSLNAVSKHLRVLEQAGLVCRRVQGREHFFSLNVRPLLKVGRWVQRYQKFWEERTDALEVFLASKRTRPRKAA